MMGLVVALFSLLNSGCISTVPDYYKKDDVMIINVTSDDNYITIFYEVPIETVYYSSGVNYFYNKSSSKLEIKFIKQDINGKIKDVMVKSVFLKDTKNNVLLKNYGDYTYVVKIPNSNNVQILECDWKNILIVL